VTRKTGTLHEDPHSFLIISFSVLRMRNFQTSVVEQTKTYFISINCFENHAIYQIMWKNIRAGQAKDNNMARAHCMLDT